MITAISGQSQVDQIWIVVLIHELLTHKITHANPLESSTWLKYWE
ncbi:hypothetical protein OMCYN_01796 [cyanobiont of Ornithocercus magnificus]|nr:hypothetical protein OMCYN_01796 [cyanobiont of Ornithocercus magnificus]